MSGVKSQMLEDFLPAAQPGGTGEKRQFTGNLVKQKLERDVNLSFETDEVGAVKLYFQEQVKVTKIRSVVQKAVAASNNGTITAANADGDMANGVVTVAAEAAIGDEDSASPTTNNVIAAGSYIQLTTAKAAAGGKVICTVEYEVQRP
jgi:hypothetical protein